MYQLLKYPLNLTFELDNSSNFQIYYTILIITHLIFQRNKLCLILLSSGKIKQTQYSLNIKIQIKMTIPTLFLLAWRNMLSVLLCSRVNKEIFLPTFSNLFKLEQDIRIFYKIFELFPDCLYFCYLLQNFELFQMTESLNTHLTGIFT